MCVINRSIDQSWDGMGKRGIGIGRRMLGGSVVGLGLGLSRGWVMRLFFGGDGMGWDGMGWGAWAGHAFVYSFVHLLVGLGEWVARWVR